MNMKGMFSLKGKTEIHVSLLKIRSELGKIIEERISENENSSITETMGKWGASIMRAIL